MLQMSVCIELIFADRDFPARIDAVADAGLPAFEFWGWEDKDIASIAESKEAHGLEVAALSVSPQVNLLEGDSIPDFLNAIRESCQVAHQLGCKRLMAHAHDVPWAAGQPWYSCLGDDTEKARRRMQHDNIVRAFKQAAPIADAEGVTLLVEPLNTLMDHSGYFIGSSQEGFSIVREVDSPSVRLLFDVYHMQIGEGNLISNLTEHIDLVGHLHVADVPGRHEPGTGEISFLNVLSAAKRVGYDGYVGLEYIPSGDSMASLHLIRQIVDQVNRRGEGWRHV